MTLAPGTPLGPYEIVRHLGSGGMGVVYEATDPRLKRTVAIKLLPPDLTRDDTAKQRFLQEAQAASALDHPNICTIFEINETTDDEAGQLYLVMAHYEGETLKEKIERGPLNLDAAVDIATQVGTGLAEAHGAGIVHRDIKPANVFITKNGLVKILDFGLAKLAGSEGVTQTGTTVGTVAYMSPEQARGQEVDHRTDIWSLGVVLYEMLAGTPPFQGENLLSLADAIRSQEPEPLTGPPSLLSGAVGQALIKAADQRYQGVAEFIGALGSPRHGASTGPVVSAVSEPSVAVLPFQMLAGGPDDAFLSVALAEAVTHGLSQHQKLVVRPTSAVMRYVEKGVTPQTVARDLNVTFVVEGSIQKLGPQLRVQIQAWDAAKRSTLLSVREDGREAELFELQDRLSELLARGFGFDDEPPTTSEPPTQDARAYELYLRAGDRLLRYSPRETRDAVHMLRQAVELDPRFAEGWARLATAAVAMGTLFDPQEHWSVDAEAAIDHALRRDPTNPEALVARARLLWSPHHGYQHVEALRTLAKTHGSPGCPHDASLWEGMILEHSGLPDEARTCLLEALEAKPDDLFATLSLGEVHVYSGNHEAAQEQYERALSFEPSNAFANLFNATGLLQLDRLDDAERAFRKARELVGEDSWLRSAEALLWAKRGEAERTDEYVRIALEKAQSVVHVHHTRHYAAAALATIGRPEDALAQLREAAATGLPNYLLFSGDRHLVRLREHPEGAQFMTTLKGGWEALRVEFGRSRPAADEGDATRSGDAVTTATTVSFEPDTPSIAVLPFLNMSADPEQEYFCDGLSEELIDALARLEGLRVVARTSAFQFRGKGHDLRQVGQTLRVKTVLEGSVRKAGNRLRVNAQLINAEDGYHLWSERYDRELEDIFDVQDEIASSVVSQLRSKFFAPARAPRVDRPTENLAAYRAFAQAHHYRVTRYDFGKAIPFYEDAVRLDPSFVRAYAGLAECAVLMGVSGAWSPRYASARGRVAVQRALALDEESSEARAALARTLFFFDWRWAEAEREFRRAVALDSANVDAQGDFGGFLGLLGRTEESLACGARVLEVDPLSTFAPGQNAVALYVGRRFDEAIAEARRALELQPDYSLAFLYLSLCYRSREDRQQAVRDLQALSERVAVPMFHGALGRALALAGEEDRAREVLAQLTERRDGTHVPHAPVALVYNGLGEHSRVLDCLEMAHAERSPGMACMLWPEWDTVREHPRFQALIRHMNFPKPVTS